MPTPPSPFIHDILEQHVEELAFLWGQRRTALRAPDYPLRAFHDLEERIAAHLHGILVPGEWALPILEAYLEFDEGDELFASAFASLHLRKPGPARRVLELFCEARGENLERLGEALSYAPLDPGLQSKLEAIQADSPPLLAAAAGEILAFHSAWQPGPEDLKPLLGGEDPELRRRGWRLVGYLILPQDPKTYAAAMRDEGPGVRRAALQAGAWCGEHGVLTMARRLAADPRPEHLDGLEILATLGGPDDLPLMSDVGACEALGPDRFRLLAAYGNPALMDTVLAGLSHSDPATAAAAGRAFTRMTGHDIESDQRTSLPPAEGGEPDEFETEFLEEVTLPDPDRARAHWAEVRGRLGRAPRICRGVDLRQELERDVFLDFDMESRWDLFLRARFTGVWDGSPLSLESFPQRR